MKTYMKLAIGMTTLLMMMPLGANAHDSGGNISRRDRDTYHSASGGPRTHNRKVYGHQPRHYFPRYDRAYGQRMGAYHPVPLEFLAQLSPPPRGHFYSLGGPQHVLLVSQRDHSVVQIISFLLRGGY